MILKSIKLSNFRSYKGKEFKFPWGTTLVVGPNRSGKTNLLEAIYLLATGRSFRAGIEAEMINYGKEIARVKGVIADSCPVPVSGIGVSSRQKAAGNALVAHRNFDSSTSEESLPPASALRRSRWRAGRATIRGVSFAESTELEIILTTGQVNGKRTAKKRYLVNSVGKRRMDFVGQLRSVLFGPEDLEIILGSPSIRRNYLDSVLEQVDREYRRANLSYQKGLRQRNKILESCREARQKLVPARNALNVAMAGRHLGGRAKFQTFRERLKRQLYFWDSLLVKNGEVITQKREEFIEFINQQPEYFGRLKVDYDKSIISPQRLEQYAQQEVTAGMTLVGPHRDDIKLKIKNEKLKMEEEKDLHIFGSRGEQRTAVLSLKLAEMEFITQKTNTRPVLLLDDIFSELDQEHRARIFEIIPRQQTIITTTDIRLVAPINRKKLKIVELV